MLCKVTQDKHLTNWTVYDKHSPGRDVGDYEKKLGMLT